VTGQPQPEPVSCGNNIQEDSRDAPYLSPGTLPPSYSAIYDIEPDPPSDLQLPSPFLTFTPFFSPQ